MKFKNLPAMTAALMVISCFSGCSDDNVMDETSGTTPASEITETVPINTAVLNDEEQNAVDEAANGLLPETELENKTIKWLAHFDLNPNSTGNSKSVALELFESKYGGNIKYYPTTWDNRFDDLSTYVLGGEGIDFYPLDTEALPRGVISGMFQPVDDYIDEESPLWQRDAAAREIFKFAGKHYAFCTGVSPSAIVYYNKQTIESFGFDDPWELYEEGNWNWTTFKDMLIDFVDIDNGYYGLDGWSYNDALRLSGGTPLVSSENNILKLNLMEPSMERTMNFIEDLYKKGLIMDLSMFNWDPQPQFMGEGKELFYFAGVWETQSDPSLWTSKVSPENMGIVPIPCDSEGTPGYSVFADGYLLCKGAENPEGVALFAECGIAGSMDEKTKEIEHRKAKDDYGWTDEMVEHYDECLRLAAEHPVYELGQGISTDFMSLITTPFTREPFRGGNFMEMRTEAVDAAELLLNEVNAALEALE